jgi:hypothetical protein
MELYDFAKHPVCELCGVDGTLLTGGCIVLTENLLIPCVICNPCNELSERLVTAYEKKKKSPTRVRKRVRKDFTQIDELQMTTLTSISPDSNIGLTFILNLLADGRVDIHPKYPDKLFHMTYVILTGVAQVYGHEVRKVPFEDETVAMVRVQMLQIMKKMDLAYTFESVTAGEKVRMLPVLAVFSRVKTFIKFRCRECDKSLSYENHFLCGQCQVYSYCSRKCQSKHWKSKHKQYCCPYQKVLLHDEKKTLFENLKQ